MLFEPDRHVPLAGVAWDADRARDAIHAIVADLEASRRANGSWPAHPLDDEGEEPATGFQSLYLGAAGTLWALWYLRQQGAATLSFAPEALIGACADAYRAHPDTEEVVPSYSLGEAGILLVQWRLTGSADAADRLWSVVESNIPNPTNEALWAAPGTMVAAWHMLQWTGEPRWRDLFLANVEQLWRTWQPDERTGCHLWTQDLYGRRRQLLGAGHGFAGNAYPLLRGAALLPAVQRDELCERTLQTLRATARREGGGANWYPEAGPTPREGKILVQWCHGAPGIVTGVADYPVGRCAEMDALLVQAGHTVWTAGPLAKGPGLCHGTAGNGYAFLALYRRTGDAVWLERARAFAMHAIVQREAMHAQHGRGRFTLWTGDPGVAVYLWHCVVGAGSMPCLDVVD